MRTLAILIVLISVAGCGRTTPSRGTIGVSVLTLTNPFFKELADSFAAEARQHGFDVIVVAGDFDVAKQKNQVEDFIAKGVDAIVLCPCDSRSIGPVIQQANHEGIPVFTADTACEDKKAKVVCHVATNNEVGGQQAASAMIEALGPAGGKVVILDFKQAESCLKRVAGFKKIIDEHNGKGGPRIQIVAELPGEGQKDRGYKAAEDALQSHQDIAGIFAINDPSALGARAALEKANKTNQVKIIGFDGQPDGKQAIREGKIYADPIQFPDQIGVKTFQQILRYFDGETLKSEELIPTALYRKSDALAESK